MRREERVSVIQRKADVYEIHSHYDEHNRCFVVADRSTTGLGCFVTHKAKFDVGAIINFTNGETYTVRWVKKCKHAPLKQLGLEFVPELELAI
jgi:hypothetical protein